VLRTAHALPAAERLLAVELWASGSLGRAWASGGIGRSASDEDLVAELVARVAAKPTAHGLAALVALRRVAPPDLHATLDAAVAAVGARHRLPAWAAADGWTVTRAWRAADVWGSTVVASFEVSGPEPFTLLAAITTLAGARVDTIWVESPGDEDAWLAGLDPGTPPFVKVEQPVPEALAALAETMGLTDMTWPRSDDDGYIEHRALAWSLCRPFTPAPDPTGWEGLPDDERTALLDAFLADPSAAALFGAAHAGPDEGESAGLARPVARESARVVADTCLDFGDGYLPEVLAWSPQAVELFLLDYLPRKVVMTAEDLAALPDVLRAWLRFCLARRGVADPWVEPVVEAVDVCLPEFRDAMSDSGSWGIGKQLFAGLTEAGVDLTDQDAIQDAIGAFNARRLAERMVDPD